MGGCKCTFHDCGISTITAKKLGNYSRLNFENYGLLFFNFVPDRETHFFHFPIRDPQRCVQWAIYSNNMAFLGIYHRKKTNDIYNI